MVFSAERANFRPRFHRYTSSHGMNYAFGKLATSRKCSAEVSGTKEQDRDGNVTYGLDIFSADGIMHVDRRPRLGAEAVLFNYMPDPDIKTVEQEITP